MFQQKQFARRSYFGFAILLGLSAGAGVTAQTQGKYRTVVLSQGTVIQVKLNRALSSKDSQTGDKFTASVENTDASGLPSGSKVEGIIREATPKKGDQPGALDLAFNRVDLPDGRTYTVNGALIGLDSKSVTHSNGRLIAKKGHRTDRLTYVGYGAGAGAIIGLFGRRKHPLEDAALGAGLGYLIGALDKHKDSKDVVLKSGTEVGVRLDSRLAFSRPVSRFAHR